MATKQAEAASALQAEKMTSESHSHGDPLLQAAAKRDHNTTDTSQREQNVESAATLPKDAKSVEGKVINDPLLEAAMEYDDKTEQERS